VAVVLFATLAWGRSANTPALCFPAGDSSQPSALQGLSNERRSCLHKPPKEQIQKERLLLPRFTPRLLVRRFPLFFEASRPSPALPPHTRKRTAGSCGLSTKTMVHVSRYAGIRMVPSDWEPPRFCLECRCRACANPRVALLAAFSRHPSRCYPLSYRPPLLC
jgi:hypothetical protein